MNKMTNFSFGDNYIMLPFHLMLTREPIIIVKNYLRVIFKLKDAF